MPGHVASQSMMPPYAFPIASQVNNIRYVFARAVALQNPPVNVALSISLAMGQVVVCIVESVLLVGSDPFLNPINDMLNPVGVVPAA